MLRSLGYNFKSLVTFINLQLIMLFLMLIDKENMWTIQNYFILSCFLFFELSKEYFVIHLFFEQNKNNFLQIMVGYLYYLIILYIPLLNLRCKNMNIWIDIGGIEFLEIY